MKFIDAFLFYNEIKMLDFRINYLKDYVDYFVIVESTFTFTGLPKKLYFDEIKEQYKDLKIVHYVVSDMPNDGDAWKNEHYQRECIRKALASIDDINADDWVIITDVDEIPNRGKLLTLKNDTLFYSAPFQTGYNLEFDFYYYNLYTKLNTKWYFPKLVRYFEILEKDIRDIRGGKHKYPVLIEYGWHFSYFFTPDLIKNKLNAFSHQEFNKDEFTNEKHIEYCIKNNKSIFYLDPTRTEELIHIPIEENNNLPEGYEFLL
jgi:beta-1,4-mannosyl-glycoprotein beta-1,4-N-acetylglucosaminyltransferase